MHMRRPPRRAVALWRAAGRGDDGQAVVEFVLILPLLALLLLMIIDFGRVFSVQIALANAAREGAHYCALHPGDTTGTRARVLGELNGQVTADTTDTDCPPVGFGRSVTVAVRAIFTPITPLVTSFTGGPIPLRTAATMEVW